MSDYNEQHANALINKYGVSKDIANNVLDCGSKLSLDWNNLSIVDAMQRMSDGIGDSDVLSNLGIFIQSNNYLKMHGLPMRRGRRIKTDY